MYDYIIVGAGPSGLTTAWLLSQIGRKCLIVDTNADIGGCHRVTVQNGRFGEHGPRIYSGAYLTFANLLRDMDGSFEEFFVPYKFKISEIGQSGASNFEWREIALLAWVFLVGAPDISVDEFMRAHSFTDRARDYANRLCRLTDGAGSNRYSLYQFLQLVNQQLLYPLYQPREPNNTGLFAFWKKKLLRAGVDILLNTKAQLVTNGVRLREKVITCKRGVILAIPPRSMQELVPLDEDWVRRTEYLSYQNFTFHWDADPLKNVPRVHGFPKSKWGVAHIVLSDYFRAGSGTIISACITMPDRADVAAANNDERAAEVFAQLRLSYPELPLYDAVVIEKNIDSAYIAAAGTKPLPHRLEGTNLYNVGPHNGHSYYAFTSLESAVSNAVHLVHEIEPLSDGYRLLEAPVTLYMLLVILLVVVGLIVALYRKNIAEAVPG